MSRFASKPQTNGTNQKTFERMKLMSMVPIDIDPANSSPEYENPLDRTYDIYQNTISNFSHTLEYSQCEVPNMDEIELSEKHEKHHKITPYVPPYKNSPSYNPEPATYKPNFEAVLPTSLKPQIRPVPPVLVPSDVSTTADILAAYDKGLRTFDPSVITNAADKIPPPDIEEVDHKIHYTFDNQPTRNLALAKKHICKNQEFFEKKAETPKVHSFDTQITRTFEFKRDSGRDYEDKAVEQMKRLKDKTKPFKMDKQLARDYVPEKNKRVEFLTSLSQQQNALMDKLFQKKEKQIVKREPQESFSTQLSRENMVRAKSEFKESKFPVDPVKSLKYVWPRTRTVTIRPPAKIVKDDPVDFWKVK